MDLKRMDLKSTFFGLMEYGSPEIGECTFFVTKPKILNGSPFVYIIFQVSSGRELDQNKGFPSIL